MKFEFEIQIQTFKSYKVELGKRGKVDFSCEIPKIALESWFWFSNVSVCDRGIVSPNWQKNCEAFLKLELPILTLVSCKNVK